MKKYLLISLFLLLITNISFSQTNKKMTYFENGNKKELVTYYDNKLSGTCIAWNESGEIIAKVRYIDGKKDGKWFMWHDNGTSAYKFYYKNNKKVGVWKFYNETGELIGEKKYDPIYERNTTITLGTFTLSDISLSITQRLNKNKPFVIGGEYSTYIADGETEDFDEFNKFSKHCVLGITGLVSDSWGILIKAGTYFGDDHDEYFNDIKYVKFNYGWEMFLIMEDEEMCIAPIMGVGVTKGMGVQIKFGFNF